MEQNIMQNHPEYPNLLFVEQGHQYFLDGVKIPGITGVITKYLFPDDYKGVDEETMQAASSRGTEIHKLLEMADDHDIYATPEQQLYKQHRDLWGFKPYGSEVLVTNGATHATAIDKVYHNEDGTVSICDIKATYKLNKDKLAWQLSINAMMYEQCFGFKVRDMWCFWIKKDLSHASFIPIEHRIPCEECARLLQADADGAETFESEWAHPYTFTDVSEQIADMVDELTQVVAYKNIYAEREKELKSKITSEFTATGAQTWKMPHVTISRTKETVRVTVDAKLLKEIAPDVYDKVAKVSVTPESVKYLFK